MSHIRLLLGVVALCGLVGCAPSAAAPPQPALPADASAPVWERVVEAAKREGKISIIGPQGSEARDALMQGFQRRYPEIEVDYSGMAGAMVSSKLLNELAAGQAWTDLVIAGTSIALEGLQPVDAVTPLAPYLVGPNLSDPSVWRGGKLSFADDAEQVSLVFSAYTKDGFVYNPDLVSPTEFKSYRDLLNPKWKGKIAMRDPNLPGGGSAAVTFYYTVDSLGTDFIRQLLAQDVVFSNDDRQMLDWVGRGQFPIVIGVGNTITNEFVQRGLPIRLMDGGSLAEGTYLTAGNGALSVVPNPPHPNALKVYLDYLLSREGQLEWSKASGFASLRRDVPSDHVNPVFVPKDGVEYRELSRESYVRLKEVVADYVRSALPR